MKIEKLKMMRFEVDDGIYCDVIPNTKYRRVYDFFLRSETHGVTVYMFGCDVDSEEDARSLVESNIDDYLVDLNELINAL